MNQEPSRFEEARILLRGRDAQGVDHTNGDLLTHLEGTARLLEAWNAREALVLAGLCHALYGTDGFEPFLVPISDRDFVRDVIGDEAEEIVYVYASCDRRFLYPQIERVAAPEFRDRHSEDVSKPAASVLADFFELTFANELELASHSPEFVATTRGDFCDLFPRCRGFVSPEAYETFEGRYLETQGS
jgi:hypothetical protein